MRRLLLIATAVAALTPIAPASASPNSYVTKVSIGQHADFDRLTVTFHGAVPNYDIRYVKKVTADPSGKVVGLRGNAKLLVTVHPTLSTKNQPQGTVTPLYPEIRQVKGAGNFESYTSYGVGLAAHRPYHVTKLTSPNRLVIDVDHP